MNWPGKLKPACFAAVAFLIVTGVIALGSPARVVSPTPRPQPVPPPVNREFRGLWIATVKNIDWPSKPTLTGREQRAEMLAILDRAAALNFNAVIFQVRPCCDAFYDSRLEPWSEYLTGQMGRSPGFFFDPLAFAITEAHKRGLELHAWFNPYRARHTNPTTPAARNHISRTRPDLVRSYDGYLWLDPSDKGTRDHSLSVVMDVVRRYDVDGVHFDDYFYPALSAKKESFPDDTNWRRYQAQGGKLSRSDWRRENVNVFVEQVYHSIKAAKPWVKFGISPPGIWQPKYPPQILRGQNAYEELYADSRKWLANGWVDYMAPQLYWPINSEWSFPVLLKWWAAQNTRNRNLWPGMSRVSEAAEQVALTRKQPGASGEIFYHAQTLLQNTDKLADTLHTVYACPALVPACPWLSSTAPGQPVLSGLRGVNKLKLSWKAAKNEHPARWIVQKRYGTRWTMEVYPFDNTSLQVKGPTLPDAVCISAVDRYGNLSAPAPF